MAEMAELLGRLRKAGLPLTDSIREAMLRVDIRKFTDYDPLPFWHDRPIVFTETERGGVKTISAPHMVVTLLHHLELSEGQEVLILGAKGGYLAALVSHIVGPEGGVTVVDPNKQVVEHVRRKLKAQNLKSRFTVRKMRSLERAPPNLPDPLNRVLVTGSLAALPRWLEERVCEGGFVIAPLGGRVSQRLVKRERQQEMVDTDLGGVLFGPVDICETEHEPAGPEQLAELFEDALEVGGELGIFADDVLHQLGQLVRELRELPETLPPLNLYAEEEVGIVYEDEEEEFIFELEGMGLEDDHPIFQLLAEAADWLTPLWPTLLALFETQMQHPGAPDVEQDEGRDFGPHGDLVPRFVTTCSLRRFLDGGPVGHLSRMVRQYMSRLSDKDVRQRRIAVRKLFELNDAAALPAFIPLLDDDSEWFRARAANAVRRWLGSGHGVELDSMAVMPRAEVRRLAAEVALRVEGSSTLLKRLSGDGKHQVRLEAWRSILLIAPLSPDSILLAFKDPHPAVRRLAVQAIERCESNNSALLALALQDTHLRVRVAALEQLALSSSSVPSELREIVASLADKPLQTAERTAALRLILPIDWEGGDFSRWERTVIDPSADEFRILIDLLSERDWVDNKIFVNSMKSSEAPNLLPRLIRGRADQWAQKLAVEIVSDDGMPAMMRLRLLEDAHGRDCSAELLDAASELSSSEHDLLAQAASSLLADVEVRTS